MAGHRLERVQEDIKRELTDIIRNLKDPRIKGIISVVRLEVSGDLSYATARISSMDGEDGTKSAVEGLKSAAGYIRREVGQRLHLRKAPEFRFIADDSISHGVKISRMLQKDGFSGGKKD